MALHFELVTPTALVEAGDATMVVVPGSEGEFGVMEGHAPFMTTLKSGELVIHPVSGEPLRFAIEGGFAEVNASGLTILAEQLGR